MKRKSIRPLSPSQIIQEGRKAVAQNSRPEFTRRVSINENLITRKFKYQLYKNDKKRRASKMMKFASEVEKPRVFSQPKEKKPINIQEELK